MSEVLDRKKPFGKIHGDEVNGRVYEQDGKFFDSMGRLWVPPPPGKDAPIYTEQDLEAERARIKAEVVQETEKNLDARIAAAVAAALAGKK